MNINSANLVRGAAALAVVTLHVAAFGLQEWNPYWDLCNVIDSAVRVCVPLFFMLSGALLLDREEALGIFLKKRFTRILLPLVFWSYFFIAWRIHVEGDQLSWSPLKLLGGPVYYHLWYLYAIVGLYLALPVLRVVHRHAPLKLQYYLLACWLAGTSFLPVVSALTGKHPGFELNFIPQYAGFFFVGALLRERRLPTQLAWGFSLLGWGATWALMDWWSHKQGAMNQLFYQYTAPNVILAAVGAFALLQHYGQKLSRRWSAPLAVIADCSFGIYFIHLPVLHALSEGWLGFTLDWDTFHPALAIPLMTLAGFSLSFVLIWLVRLIPGMNKVV